jgi:hypothetical protein
MRCFVYAAIGAALISSGAGAAEFPQSGIDDPEATMLSDLIVVAPTNGPAWWRVSKGDSVVWIMGMPASSTPTRQTWDTTALKHRLKGAKALLLPPRAKVTTARVEYVPLAKAPPGVRRANRDLDQARVKAVTTPALAARFVRAQALIHDGGPIVSSPPAAAFFGLYVKFHSWARLDLGGRVLTTATTAARQANVPVFQPPSLGDLKFDASAPSRPDAAACFTAILDDVEVPLARYRAVGEGWARGDLVVATSGPREALGICENRLFNQGASRRTIEVQVAVIEAALETPGKTVALANLRALLADEGILDRLAAKGYQIVYPTGLGDAD